MAAILLTLLLSSCTIQESAASKSIEAFVKSIESTSKSMDVAETAVLNIPKIEHDDLLIVINAGYAGYFKAGDSIVSNKLEEEINKYGSKEVALTYILLISGESVIAEKSLSSVNFITDNKPDVGNNAKVAVHTDSKAMITCVPRQKQSENYSMIKPWNSKCIAQLVGFE